MKRIKVKTELDSLTLLELFWVEPTISEPTEGYSCYQVEDRSGLSLKFGVNTVQESVQLELKLANAPIMQWSFELVEFIDIIDTNTGQFSFLVSPTASEVMNQVEVQLRPQLKIAGATLEK